MYRSIAPLFVPLSFLRLLHRTGWSFGDSYQVEQHAATDMRACGIFFALPAGLFTVSACPNTRPPAHRPSFLGSLRSSRSLATAVQTCLHSAFCSLLPATCYIPAFCPLRSLVRFVSSVFCFLLSVGCSSFSACFLVLSVFRFFASCFLLFFANAVSRGGTSIIGTVPRSETKAARMTDSGHRLVW